MTQPALSHFLTKTEEEEGVKLFDRTTVPITLTYAGELYIETARKILALNRQLLNEIDEIASWNKGRLVVGIPPVRSAYRLPHIIREYSKKFPGIQFQVVEHNSQRLRDDVQSGRVDVAVSPVFDGYGSCGCVKLYDEELFLVCQTGALPEWDYTVSGDGTRIVQLENLISERFVLVKKGQEIRKAVNHVFESFGLSPKSVTEVTNSETCYSLASAGMGLTIVPKMNIDLIKTSFAVDVFRISGKGAYWPIGILYKGPFESLSKPVLQFIEVCRQI